MRRNVHQSKHDPLVDEVEIIEANPQYAYVRYLDGRESTVSTKQLAPAGVSAAAPGLDNETEVDQPRASESTEQTSKDEENIASDRTPVLRRSTRPPEWFRSESWRGRMS